MDLALNSKATRLAGAVDQLAATHARYMAGEVMYGELAKAFDAVAEAKADTGTEWLLVFQADGSET